MTYFYNHDILSAGDTAIYLYMGYLKGGRCMKCFWSKRVMAFCMAAAMIFGSCPVDAWAEEHQSVTMEETAESTGSTGTGESFETAIDITETGACDIVVPANNGAVYVKYTSVEAAKIVLGMTRSVAKEYSSSVYLELYDEQNSDTYIRRWFIGLSGTDTVNNEYSLEQGKTYVFKITVSSESTDTNLAFSVKKNT